jgi:probable FeS assembly SUF system protein SufT
MSRTRPEPFELGWDSDVTLIPSGRAMTLRAGERVVIVQALGGTITVQTESGHLARISSEDAHRLGLDTQPVGEEIAASGLFDLERVIEQLKTVFDPEIPINVVDLGLIYACDAYELADGSHRVEIKMSMTAPGCGMGDVLRDDARSRVRTVSGVSDVNVELVWDPPWDLSRMSDAARLELGMF